MFKRIPRDTWRLTISYLMVIMSLSFIFSFVIYGITSSQLRRPIPPKYQSNTYNSDFNDELAKQRFNQRAEDARESVLLALVLLNIFMLVFGAVLGFVLARRTLGPIEEMMESQVRFVSDASHELRTPLTSIRTSSEVALRKKQLTENKSRQVIQRTVNEVDKMQQLISGLLSLASGNKSEQRQKLKISSVVEEVYQYAKNSSLDSRNKIEVSGKDFEHDIYKSSVFQIMKVFIDNAIKYSPKNSTIKINYGRKFIEVEDSGQGIETKDIDRIFDRFYRSDKARTRTEDSSHGLGLAIAKDLANSCGYNIKVSSQIGKGSKFKLEL